MVYHVTSGEAAREILRDGFFGSWGDAGFGVYFFDDLGAAQVYLARGGWDGSLDPSTAMIIMVDPDDGDIHRVDVHPDWPNPRDYDHVVWHPMSDVDEDAHWRPRMSVIVEAASPSCGA